MRDQRDGGWKIGKARKSRMGDYTSTTPTPKYYTLNANHLPYLCADNIRTILLLIPCASKYVQCLYRHIFLYGTCTNIKVTKIICIPSSKQY